MEQKNYVQPTIFVIPLEGEVIVSTSVLDNGDHVVQPGNNWMGEIPKPSGDWTDWF